MADPQDSLLNPIDLAAVGAQLAAGILANLAKSGWDKGAVATAAQSAGVVKALIYETIIEESVKLGSKLHELEEPFLPVIAGFVAPIIAGLFGAEVDEGSFARKMARGAGTAAAEEIVAGLMKAITGDESAGEISPGPEGSKRIAAAAVQASLESSFNALVPEIISDIFPDVGHFTGLMELPESIIRTLGVSRLVRQALRPFVNATCTVPATWYVNKQHPHTLLGHGEVARQLARGKWTQDQALEELARGGYSDDRIEALLNSVAKFRSVSDVYRLIRAAAWDEGAGTQHLKDQGYDEDGAATELLLEKLKAIEAFDRAMATAGVDGFVAGRLDEGELGGFLGGVTISPQEKAQHTELAHGRRIAARRPLSPAEVAAAVKDEILSYADYRDALTRDGRTEDAITVLELQLRATIDKSKSIADHKAAQEADKLAAKKAAEAAALVKKTAADAKLALAKRGTIGALEQAFIRGLLPIERVQEVYDATYDPDAVAALVALVEDKRAAYVAQQTAAAALKARATTRGVNVAELDGAVLTHVLTLDQYQTRLHQLGFADADVALLVATLSARLDQAAAAAAAHAAAAAAAKVKHIDLKGYELLVRRGHRTRADYDALLTSLGYDAASVAALDERLSLLIDDDTAAAALHAAAAAKLKVKGLSLDQFRRAVILGVRPIGDYGPFLLANGFSAPDIATLVAELQADVEAADAARARRAAADRRSQANRIPLADLRRAARLGRLPIPVYVARLTEETWPQADIDLEIDLLTQEIADVQATRAARADAAAAAKNKDVGLPQLEKAVRAGVDTVERYVTAARAAGYRPDAAAELGALLQEEIASAAAVQARKVALAAAAAVKHVSLAQLEAAVLAGVTSLDSYTAALTALGYAADDIALLTGLVSERLDKLAAARARQAALDAANATKALSRAEFAKLVVAGIRTPEAYGAFLTTDGYSDDDVAALVDLVTTERTKTVAADARRAELAAANPTREIARALFAKGVVDGLRTTADYAAFLTEQHYDPDDVQLLVDLVLVDVNKAAAKAAPPGP